MRGMAIGATGTGMLAPTETPMPPRFPSMPPPPMGPAGVPAKFPGETTTGSGRGFIRPAENDGNTVPITVGSIHQTRTFVPSEPSTPRISVIQSVKPLHRPLTRNAPLSNHKLNSVQKPCSTSGSLFCIARIVIIIGKIFLTCHFMSPGHFISGGGALGSSYGRQGHHWVHMTLSIMHA